MQVRLADASRWRDNRRSSIESGGGLVAGNSMAKHKAGLVDEAAADARAMSDEAEQRGASELVEITADRYPVVIDLVYATPNNLAGRPVYAQARCALRSEEHTSELQSLMR